MKQAEGKAEYLMVDLAETEREYGERIKSESRFRRRGRAKGTTTQINKEKQI